MLEKNMISDEKFFKNFKPLKIHITDIMIQQQQQTNEQTNQPNRKRKF